MLQIDDNLRSFADWLKEGIILLDRQGLIRLYNRKAREIFGLDGASGGVAHPPGRLAPGDIVILADNAFGVDDGNLTPEQLGILGIYPDRLAQGDALLAIGLYQPEIVKEKGTAINRPLGPGESLRLGKLFAGVYIDVRIDDKKRRIRISLRGHNYDMEYYRALGHMVVLDGASKTLKFCQANGYTARNESIGQLLAGGGYLGKGAAQAPLKVEGRHLLETHSDNLTMQEVLRAAAGENIAYDSRPAELNGFPTLCTLIPIRHGPWQGALLKVEDITDLDRVIEERDAAVDAAEEMERLLVAGAAGQAGVQLLAGDSPVMGEIRQQVLQAARTTSSVLLTGESGTGKSIIAKAIHQASRRSSKPFVQVNCGAIPANLLESELFGYVRGAFTGAAPQGKPGYFELAQGGTIFLDEIGELDSASQVKLLQVLQNRTVRRVGGQEEIGVDVRFIAATNRNLAEELRQGGFREDLFYRLNVIPIHVAPLRERKEDIYSLALHMLPGLCRRLEVPEREVAPETFYCLLQHNWPGNIRELENVLERSIALAEGRQILPEHLPPELQGRPEPKSQATAIYRPRHLKEVLAQAEGEELAAALAYYNGDRQLAMEALGIGKTNFYEKLKRYGLGGCVRSTTED